METPEIQQQMPSQGFKYFPFFNKNQPLFVLVLLGLLFYGISIFNEYALDDGIIIHQNEYVLKGIRGVPDLLTKDMYDSFYRRMNASDQLEGGRYRPLTTITYALEQEAIGTYRTGFYNRADDMNQNGKLDDEPVKYIEGKQWVNNYEYNDFVDLNHDNIAQPNECYSCWDQNKNFRSDTNEDLNQDGVFNEVDCQVKGAWLRHLDNILLYILCCLLVYFLCRDHLFRLQPDMAFLAALIFLVHPVHSEVVANIKGRDELLSVIFICLSLIFSLRFIERKTIGALTLAAIMFFMALMSKEYALLLPIVIPMVLHVFTDVRLKLNSLVLIITFLIIGLLLIFLNDQVPGFVLIVLPFIYAITCLLVYAKKVKDKDEVLLQIALISVCLIYLAIRLSAVGLTPGVPDTEILNNPYLLASGEEQFASKVVVMLRYLLLIIFPKHLVSDYSYATFGYSTFTSWQFILSLIVNMGLITFGVRSLVKRQVIGFAIMFYYLFLLPVCNFFFASSTVMLETYLFHASIGFSIAFSWLIITGFQRLETLSNNTKRTVLLSALAIIVLVSGLKTVERCKDWKNDITLFLKDVNNAPNSVLVLGNAGARWIDLADTKEITGVALPGEDPSRVNDYNGTLHITDEEVKNGGYENKREAALNKGIDYLERAVKLHPRYVNGLLNLGLAYFKLNNDEKAIFYWKNAEVLYPDNPYLRNYYNVYCNILTNRGTEALSSSEYAAALKEFKRCTLVDPNNEKGWYYSGVCYYQLRNYSKAKECWEKALRLKPDYKEAKEALEFKFEKLF
jgi:tetratricopeptide (TPR) repeat protein